MERLLTRLLGEVRARRPAFAEAPEDPARLAAAANTLGCAVPDDFALFLTKVGTVPWPLLIRHPTDFPVRRWPSGFVPFASDGEHYFGYLVEHEPPTERDGAGDATLTARLPLPGRPADSSVQVAWVSVSSNELSVLPARTFTEWLKETLDRETTGERGTSETIAAARPHGSQPAVGARFDRYRIEGELGAGGMGQVYRALDTKLRRRVALKVLKVDGAGQAAALAALLREARLAAALDHPNVVRIFDVGESDGTAFVSMELVKGSSLRKFVGDETVGIGRKLRWLLLVASALAAAHRRGLVHRDIKPENVMIGEDSDVKVLDFGIARVASGSQEKPFEPTTFGERDEPTGGISGTPKYMAPEQIRGEPVDGRCDQFAWGVMAYELMVGASPWGDGDVMSVLARVLTNEAVPLAQQRPDIPAAVSLVIERAMKKNPAERFVGMEDLIAALGELPDPSGPLPRVSSGIHSSPIAFEQTTRDPSLPPISSTYGQGASKAAPPPRAGHRWLALGAAVLGLCGILGAVAYFVHAKRTASERPPVNARPVAVAVSDLPIPETPAPEALRLYQDALRDFRAGAPSDVPKLKLAIAADPTFAAARFQLALILVWAGGDARTPYLEADKLKDKLGPRDAATLQAIRPCAVPEPADYETCRKEVAKVVAAYPNDAQLALLNGAVSIFDGDVAAALAEAKRAAALDPQFGMAIGAEVEELDYSGDTAQALTVAESCLGTSNGVCWLWGAWTADQVGRPDLFEKFGRQLFLANGTASAGFAGFANALAANGSDRAAVEDALRSYLASIPEKNRAWRQERDQAALDALEGNFASAAKRLEAIVDAGVISEDMWRWVRVPSLWLDVLRESGDAKTAGRIAKKLRARLPGLPGGQMLEDIGLACEPLPILIDTERGTGALDAVEHAKLRDQWTTAMTAITRPIYRPYIWANGHAARLDSPEAAREAIAAAPRFGGIPKFTPRTTFNLAFGRMYQLAGDRSKALPYLALAAKSSAAIEYPIAFVRAQLYYGIALAEQGDKAPACDAFAKVISRWGRARPRSVSAEDARARRAALGCER